MKWTKYQKKACGGYMPISTQKWLKNDSRHKEFKTFKKKHGFYPFELWNLNEEIISFILPRLVYYRDHLCGIPGGMTQEEYEAQLDACIKAFRHYLNNDLWEDEIEEAFYDFMNLLPSLWQ